MTNASDTCAMNVRMSVNRNGNKGARLALSFSPEAAKAAGFTSGKRIFCLRRGRRVLAIPTGQMLGRILTFSEQRRGAGRVRACFDSVHLQLGLKFEADVEASETVWGPGLLFDAPEWFPWAKVIPADNVKPGHHVTFCGAAVPLPPISDAERERLIREHMETVGPTRVPARFCAPVQGM